MFYRSFIEDIDSGSWYSKRNSSLTSTPPKACESSVLMFTGYNYYTYYIKIDTFCFGSS